MRRVLLLTFFLASLASAKDMLVKVPVANKAQLDIIYRDKYAVVDRDAKSVTLYVNEGQFDKIKAMGLKPVVIIDNIQQYTKERTSPTNKVDTSITMHYHTYAQTVYLMDSIASANPSICKLDTIGYSVQGRLILAMKISDNPGIKEDEAEVRIVGCHHGNEWPASEIPLFLIAYLTERYNTDSYVHYLVNNREIWIMPMLNPDGHELHQRENANNIDLNRNYGYMWRGDGGDTIAYGQPETRAMYRWSQRENFTMGLTYHTYHPAVNYIWNYSPDHIPDSALVVDYANMYGDSTADHGDAYWVTEGYDWYQTFGDLNDYSAGIDGINDVTIELCHEFVPPDTELDTTWHINRGAMLAFINKAGQGIHGYVMDSATGDTLKQAVVDVEGIDWPVFTDSETGDYFKTLLPGTYTVVAWANGYQKKSIPGIVVYSDSATKLDIYLAPGGENYAYKLVEAVIDNQSPPSIKPHAPWVLGAPDGKYVSLNNNGYVVLDMGEHTPVNYAVKVYEGDDGTPDESYLVYGADSFYGPFTYIGHGSGTSICYLNGSGLAHARYIEIKDAGGNSSSGSTAGFDLDAVMNMPLPQGAYVVLNKTEVIDTEGVINGSLDPGDRGFFKFNLKNIGTQNAYSVKFKLTSLSSYVQVESDTVVTDSIQTGDSVYVNRGFDVLATTPEGQIAYIKYDIILGDSITEDTLVFVVGQKDSLNPQGPDDYGYFAYDISDSAYTEWEPLSFIDIQGPGINLNLQDDQTAIIHLPFVFKYYGQYFDSVSICSNGWVALGSHAETDYINTSIPSTSAPPSLVAPFWDDLSPQNGGGVYYYFDADSSRFIIEWAGVPLYNNSSAIESFEIILRDSSFYPTITGDGEVLFIYQRVSDSNSCSVGIASPSQSSGLQYLYDGDYDNTATALAAGRFIKFTTDTPCLNIDENRNPANNIVSMSVPTIQKGNIVFSVRTNAHCVSQFNIYDVQGRLVLNKTIALRPGLNNLNIGIKSAKRGVYFIILKGERWKIKKKILRF